MIEQRFSTVHVDGVSLLRVVLEAVALNDSTILGYRVIIENRREDEVEDMAPPEPEIMVRFFHVESPRSTVRVYNDAYVFGLNLSGVMECDYLDRAIIYLRGD